MHCSTGRAGSVGFAPRQQELQRVIEEKQIQLKQLYERQCRVRAAMLRQQDFKGARVMRDQPQLRIRGSPAQARPPHRAASQTPSPSGIGPSESVAFTITSERRRLRPRIAPQNPDSRTVFLGARSKLTRNRPSPSKEFAIRLSRLHKASASGAATVPEAVAVSATKEPLSDSPDVSPIAAECPAGPADVSAGSYWSSISALFGDPVGMSCLGRGDVEGARHVRFSSRSPQVATFSVERSCVPLEEGFDAMVVAAAATPGTPASDGEKQTLGPELDLIKAASAPLDTAAQRVSSLAMSPFASSRYSAVLSPRTTVSSYLTQIEELRHSLLEAPSDTRYSGRGFDDDTRLPARRSQDLRMSGQPSVMEKQVEREGAATPAKQWTLVRTRDLGESVGAAAVGINSTTMSGALGLAVPVPSSVPVAPVMWEASVCFTENSPIFLRRPERRVGLSTQDSCESPLLTNITNQPPKSSAPPPPRLPMSREESAVTVHKLTKCVRFRESVERSDKGTSGTACKRRRPGWRPAPSSASAPAVGGVPIVMPAELCCEQEGFGAGILLACGPTLYFD
ncbi:conserved hypothetical protein [Leishmania major strain Friedlin]|uniref:Uncharacterized protein n=1 Tax=Leishmania major TaxID=5664 RepID=Q4Q5G3_LEIMA|nr:conserved hypothetical protein [Leishmania major strain Friedlin]CAG9580167.1 hypothetical_protein_-_conserved [Leishmania major strain Friedlin]CAJ08639.1 conserved hypothetical protein [Leishmania major strain Friedlin]|eukprot:XP_001685435.1 conserved hypothetical protein [Leishmania major strain Friedlin]